MFAFDLVSAVLVMAAAVAVILYSRGLPPPEAFDATLGPGSWPSFLGYALLALGAALLIEALARRLGEGRAGREETPSEPPPIDFSSPGMFCIYKICGILAGFAALLTWLNLLAATAFMVPACMLLLGERRLPVLAAMTAGVPIAVHVIFALILRINLP